MFRVGDVNDCYGYPPEKWNAAREKLTRALWIKAAAESQMSYSDGTQILRDLVPLEPHDSVFHQMLGQISILEDAGGKGMLSALVVHKYGDQQPGPGFFDLAAQLGRDVHDKEKCWIDEVKRLYEEAKTMKL